MQARLSTRLCPRQPKMFLLAIRNLNRDPRSALQLMASKVHSMVRPVRPVAAGALEAPSSSLPASTPPATSPSSSLSTLVSHNVDVSTTSSPTERTEPLKDVDMSGTMENADDDALVDKPPPTEYPKPRKAVAKGPLHQGM
jgi:hypothetical protein